MYTVKSKIKSRFKTRRVNSIFKHPYIQKETQNIIVRNRVKGVHSKPYWQVVQSGGARVESHGYTFLYEKNNSIYTCVANKPYTGLCFKIEFNKDDKTIMLDIGYSPGCSANKELPKSSGTLAMLSAILQIIFSHKDIKRYNSIQLSDTSAIPCKSFIDNREYMIELSNMYFLSTGCTWYATLSPMFLLSKSEEDTYLNDKKRILNKSYTWNTLLSELPSNSANTLNSIIQFEDSAKVNEPAHHILNMIRDAKFHCIIFKMFMDDLLKTFKVSSMKGKVWCIPLRNGRIVGCKEVNECINPEKEWILSEFIDWVSNEEYTNSKITIQSDDIPVSIQVDKVNYKY